MPHKHVQTVYPPLALALFSLGSWLPWPLLGVKILLCFVEIIGCWLLIGLAQRLGLPAGRAAWYCWSPLATLEVAGMGHVDAMVLTASVGTVFLLAGTTRSEGEAETPTLARSTSSARSTAFAGIAAAAGVLSKLIPLVALPLWARRSARPAVFLGVAFALVSAALLPIGIAAGGMPPGLVTYGVSWEFNGPLYEPLWRVFDRLDLTDTVKGLLDRLKTRTGWHDALNRFYPYVYPQLLAKVLLVCVFGLFVLYSLRPRLETAHDAVIGSGQLLGGLVLCVATVYPWYLLWILPWAALARHPAWLLLSGLMPLAYVPQLFSVSLFPWVYLALWGPFFALLLSARWVKDWRWSID